MVDDDFVLSHENFTEVEMHNAQGFVIDDRPELEYSAWSAAPCMENCKDEVQVTMRTVFLVETPPEGGSNSVMNHAREVALPSFTAAGPSFIPEATEAPVEDASATVEVEAVATDDGSALAADGEKVFRKCKSCHQIGAGAKNRTGPVLTGIMGAGFGTAEGFNYSSVFQAAASEGRIWTDEEMAGFLAKPKSYMNGTKMSFAGLKSEDDIAAVIAYLRSVGG
jgi:cytochrome c